jgi:hypothetical protein
MTIVVFKVVILYKLVGGCQHFKETFCHHPEFAAEGIGLLVWKSVIKVEYTIKRADFSAPKQGYETTSPPT